LPSERAKAGPYVMMQQASRLGKHLEMRGDSTREIIIVQGIPVDRPGHRATYARPGSGGLERAAVGPHSQAIKRGIDDRGRDNTATSCSALGRQSQSYLIGTQAVLELDAGQSNDEVFGALIVELAIAAVHRTRVVILHVDDSTATFDV